MSDHEQDPPSSDGDADAMAQALGFSSFGSQHRRPSKKRRFNPSADGVVSRPPPATGANADEIGLADDDNDDGAGAGTVEDSDTSAAQSILPQRPVNPNRGSSPVAEGAQARAFSTLPAAPSSLPQRPGAPATMDGDSSAGGPQQQQAQHHRHGGGGRGGGRGGARHGAYAGHHAGGNDLWYEDYYDPMSNENPWARLEQSLGLPSVGTWVSRSAAPPAKT